MLIATASLFSLGVGLFIYDFFRFAPRLEVDQPERMPDAGTVRAGL